MHFAKKIQAALFFITLFMANAMAVNLNDSVSLADQGFVEIRTAGKVPQACHPEAGGKFDVEAENPVVVASSTDFCNNPVGYMCGGSSGIVSRLAAFRGDPAFRAARSTQLAIKDDGTDVAGNDYDTSNGGASIFAAFARAKLKIVQKLNSCTKCGSKKADMITRVKNVRLKVFANEKSPTSSSLAVQFQQQKCGINLMSSNAEYIPEGNYVYVCLGTIVASTPAGTNWTTINVGNYLMGTLGHEIGHAIDGYVNEVRDGLPTGNTIKEPGVHDSYDSFYNCAGYAKSDSIYDFKGPHYGQFEAEINADYWSNVALSGVANATNRDVLISGRAKLCTATGGADSHHKTADRIKMIRNNPQIAALFNCPVQPKSCMAEGPVTLP